MADAPAPRLPIVPADRFAPGLLQAQAAERGLVRLLGGYTVGLPGGTLLVNEKLPVARFNLVQLVRVGRQRQTAFFEAALDHYFQRALRPTVRVALPVPAHVDHALRELAFQPRTDEERWLVAGPERPRPRARGPGAVEIAEPDLGGLLQFWAGPRERLELLRQLTVGLLHPNPGERLQAFRAPPDGPDPGAATLTYRRGPCLLLEAVGNPEDPEDPAGATAIVRSVLERPDHADAPYVALRSTRSSWEKELRRMGFVERLTSRIYELPEDAELALRVPPAHTQRLWRPPPVA